MTLQPRDIQLAQRICGEVDTLAYLPPHVKKPGPTKPRYTSQPQPGTSGHGALGAGAALDKPVDNDDDDDDHTEAEA